ncbi:MAG: lysophospholipid acyltransferase family protein, partial [Holosporales bacterium]
MALFKKILRHPRVIDMFARLAAGYIGWVYRSSQWTFLGREIFEAYWRENKPFIVAFWHNRLLLGCFIWQNSRPFHMLISAHRDGQLIAKTVGHYGIHTVAGSTKKGGTQALRAMVRLLQKGETVGITPDGPRGPRYQVSDGTVALARLGKVDVIPVAYATNRAKILHSWDRFILALPYG